MIEYKQGDILNEHVDALVNTVNCVGVMGRGIALQFKNAFPENYKEYARACKQNLVKLGYMYVYAINQLIYPHFIVNFPTKYHWRSKSRLLDIEKGIDDLLRVIEEYNIASIAIPPLGCGLGGLSWSSVRKILEQKLVSFPTVRFIIFEPSNVTCHNTICVSSNVPLMTHNRAVLIMLMSRYLHVLLDPFMTLLEVHKLMYFMQTSGEQLQLYYKKAYFGPYAENLRHLCHTLEGHYISGYSDNGDEPNTPITLMPEADKTAQSVLEQQQQTLVRMERVFQLIEGFESAFGLELLASVHFLVAHDSITSLKNLVEGMYLWNQHKKQFSRRQIALAADVLRNNGWICSLEN